MTWLSTWVARAPGPTTPQYAAHDTEQAAEAHARELVASGRARVATVYQCQTHATGPQSDEHAQTVPECHPDPARPSESERP